MLPARLFASIIAVAALAGAPGAIHAAVDAPECISPAKPGGGFFITCRLLQAGLQATGLSEQPIRITELTGGIGAVAFNALVSQRPSDGNAIVAFSSGSLLNIAQRKFGRYSESDVRWLAVVGMDYGVIAVRSDSEYQKLGDLIAALKLNPKQVLFATAGTVGSQDWMKMALVAKSAGIDSRAINYAAFEGGGESLVALLGGYVQAVSGDLAEALPYWRQGRIRLLAVLSETRLPGRLAAVPTAKEQGVDLVWPVVRGFYMAPKVSERDFENWTGTISKLVAAKEFHTLREEYGLYPFVRLGEELDAYIKSSMVHYRKLTDDFKLPGQ